MNNDIWPRVEDDYMEFGGNHWVPIAEGKFFNTITKETMDENGDIFNQFGELVQRGDDHDDDEQDC